ncbi:MAG: helix-turn-helix domain-containing protein [Clostridia bacterium]|nr:helix-turn-helix domain-containing protein [Clostridia bacterium]
MQCYEQGKRSFRDISIEIGAGESTVKDWWMIYQSQGFEGLKRRCSHKQWDKNIKIAAVEDYLCGKYSLRSVCMKYKISDTGIVYIHRHCLFGTTPLCVVFVYTQKRRRHYAATLSLQNILFNGDYIYTVRCNLNLHTLLILP